MLRSLAGNFEQNVSGPGPSGNRGSAKDELHGVQMLRAVAAISVVIHHALEQSNGAAGRFSPDWLTTCGAAGVDIFFVISGFIMFYVSFKPGRPPTSAGDFLFRRATRIYPFYWSCCLALLLMLSMGFLASHHYSASDIILSLLLLPGGTLIDVSWTLVYEVYFYAIFAACLVFRSFWVAIIGTTAAILFLLAGSQAFPQGILFNFLSNPIPLEFCFGLWLGLVFCTRGKRRWPVNAALSIAGFAIMAVAPLFVPHADTSSLPPMPRLLAWGIPAVCAVAGFLAIGAPQNLTARIAVSLGNASYAIYLTHIFVTIAYGRLIKISAISRLPQAPLVLAVVLAAIFAGVAAHNLLEKPLLHFIRKLTHRQPGHSEPA